MANVIGQSADGNVAGVFGENTGSGGIGVQAKSGNGIGLVADSVESNGVLGRSVSGNGIVGEIIGDGIGAGVVGGSGKGDGVRGQSDTGNGVTGESKTQNGVFGRSQSSTGAAISAVNTSGGPALFAGASSGIGVSGNSDSNVGVKGESKTGNGVFGISQSPTGAAISAENKSGGPALFAGATGGIGVSGNSDSGVGVKGESKTTNGVLGITHGNVAAISALNQSGASDGIGLFSSGGIAGQFFGKVEIKGDLTMLSGADIRLADFSEDFDVSGQEELEPGTVVVLDREGSVQKSQTAYDKKVAGVISGAGDFRPAITLDRQTSQGHRIPIALMGKVYCKVDAQYSAVDVGDLLTTSPTPGHAMKADDPLRALGTLIGKALRRLETGQGLIPILVALQ